MDRKSLSEPWGKRKRSLFFNFDCESSSSNFVKRTKQKGNVTCIKLKNTKLNNVDKWKDLFDKTIIPSKNLKICEKTVAGKKLSIWYTEMGKDSMSKSGGSSRRSGSRSTLTTSVHFKHVCHDTTTTSKVSSRRLHIMPTGPAKFCDGCGAPFLRDISMFCSQCGFKGLGT